MFDDLFDGCELWIFQIVLLYWSDEIAECLDMILCDGIWPASITLGLKHRVQTNTEYGDGHWGGGGVRGGLGGG